jgi:hypothetical protein
MELWKAGRCSSIIHRSCILQLTITAYCIYVKMILAGSEWSLNMQLIGGDQPNRRTTAYGPTPCVAHPLNRPYLIHTLEYARGSAGLRPFWSLRPLPAAVTIDTLQSRGPASSREAGRSMPDPCNGDSARFCACRIGRGMRTHHHTHQPTTSNPKTTPAIPRPSGPGTMTDPIPRVNMPGPCYI